jgi:hypothetical protein
MAGEEELHALTRGALLRLASVCDRLGDQADPSTPTGVRYVAGLNGNLRAAVGVSAMAERGRSR